MKRGFTLVELLLVVVILAILASVALPMISNATDDTRLATLQADLATVRRQIDLYRLQHNGLLPSAANFKHQMRRRTHIDGTVDNDGAFGPYLIEIPFNPFTDPPANSTTTSASGPDKAWYYNELTGEFRANNGGSTGGIAHNSL